MEPLSRLISPKSIAVIGGGFWCESVVRQNRDSGFVGPIWPIHPTRKEIAGVPAYPSLDALPGAPDAAFVGVNRRLTIDIVRDLAMLGCGGAVCFANGYAEAVAELPDGASLQADLVAAAGAMRILGPNCYGFVNMLDRVALWPDRHGMDALESGVAILGQSSHMLFNMTMQRRGLPLATVLGVGNQSQTTMADIGAAMLEDPRITALGLHIEGVTDLRAFEQLSIRAHQMGKPVVTLKVGRSEQARDAVISHTASLAGSHAGAQAFLARLGMAEVDTVAEFVEALKLCHMTGGLPGATAASASCSGGEASLIADLGSVIGVSFPGLEPAQKTALRTVLGEKIALANPLDYNTHIWDDQEALKACFIALSMGPQALTCVVLDMPRSDRFEAADFKRLGEAAIDAKSETGRAMAVVSLLPEGLPEDVCKHFIAAGVTPLCGMREAVAAIRAAATARPSKAARPAPVLLPGKETQTRVFGEAEAKQLLSDAGLRIPRSHRAADPQEAAKRASDIGFPVVLKGEGFAHKTEAGAVVLGLTTEGSVRQAAANMSCESFLVEEMVDDATAELLVGVVCDPVHGFVLTLGLGGALTELIADTQSLLLPSSRSDVLAALKNLKTSALLFGYRGKAAADIDAVLDSVMALQTFVSERSETLAEVEINPLICGASGAVAADALIRMGDDK